VRAGLGPRLQLADHVRVQGVCELSRVERPHWHRADRIPGRAQAVHDQRQVAPPCIRAHRLAVLGRGGEQEFNQRDVGGSQVGPDLAGRLRSREQALHGRAHALPGVAAALVAGAREHQDLAQAAVGGEHRRSLLQERQQGPPRIRIGLSPLSNFGEHVDALLEERVGKRRLVGEPPVHGANANAGLPRNVVQSWIISAYALAFGSLLLFGGRLSDLFGRRAVFLTGLIGFALASAVGGGSVSFTMLLIARACQGLFAALLAPSALSPLTTTFSDPRDRGRAFGVYGAIAGGGGLLGLLLGGLLTEYLDWRWCLYVNLVFAVLAGAGAVIFLPRRQQAGSAQLDFAGVALVSGSMFCLVQGFSNVASHSWHATSTWDSWPPGSCS
jgi:hypothetical protein